MSVIDFGVLLHVSLVFSPLLCATHSLKESIFSPFSSLECVNYWVMCQGLDFVKQSFKTYCHHALATAGVFVVFVFFRSVWQQFFIFFVTCRSVLIALQNVLGGYSTHMWNSIVGSLRAKRWKCKSVVWGSRVWLVISYDRHWTTVMTRESKNFYPPAKT